MIYIGADHAGYNLKEEIKKYLDELGYQSEDLGNKELDPQDDYPDFAFEVAKKVAETGEKGILICGTGIGSCIAANKIKGARAAQAWDEFTAAQSREHNNSNILCLGGRVLDAETAKKIVRIWLETEFSGEERHMRRLKKIEMWEAKPPTSDVGGLASHIEVIPTIIAKDFKDLQEKIRKVEPYVDWAQLDIMDGKFVKESTWNSPGLLREFKTKLRLEAHLMVANPEEVIVDWIDSGVKRIIVHFESTSHLKDVVDKIKLAGLEVGLAINPKTPIEVLDEFIPHLDLVLIMTVEPGRGGQELIEDTLTKIRRLREKYQDIKIAADGGINIETAPQVIAAGANILASGSAIFTSEDIKETIKELKQE